MTATTTSTPATAPMAMASLTFIRSAPAVIPTSPPRMPFRTIDRSGFRIRTHEAHIAAMAPALAASDVVTRTRETAAGSADSTEPPLKPNHPNHSRNTPMVASGMLCPKKGRLPPSTNFPIRGPRNSTPASAPHPPTPCTRVDPAKS